MLLVLHVTSHFLGWVALPLILCLLVSATVYAFMRTEDQSKSGVKETTSSQKKPESTSFSSSSSSYSSSLKTSSQDSPSSKTHTCSDRSGAAASAANERDNPSISASSIASSSSSSSVVVEVEGERGRRRREGEGLVPSGRDSGSGDIDDGKGVDPFESSYSSSSTTVSGKMEPLQSASVLGKEEREKGEGGRGEGGKESDVEREREQQTASQKVVSFAPGLEDTAQHQTPPPPSLPPGKDKTDHRPVPPSFPSSSPSSSRSPSPSPSPSLSLSPSHSTQRHAHVLHRQMQKQQQRQQSQRCHRGKSPATPPNSPVVVADGYGYEWNAFVTLVIVSMLVVVWKHPVLVLFIAPLVCLSLLKQLLSLACVQNRFISPNSFSFSPSPSSPSSPSSSSLPFPFPFLFLPHPLSSVCWRWLKSRRSVLFPEPLPSLLEMCLLLDRKMMGVVKMSVNGIVRYVPLSVRWNLSVVDTKEM